jgi:hypothetical protein
MSDGVDMSFSGDAINLYIYLQNMNGPVRVDGAWRMRMDLRRLARCEMKKARVVLFSPNPRQFYCCIDYAFVAFVMMTRVYFSDCSLYLSILRVTVTSTTM